MVLEVEPRPYSHMLGRCSVCELHPQPPSNSSFEGGFHCDTVWPGMHCATGQAWDSPASASGLTGIPSVTEVTVFCTCAAWFSVTSSQLLCVRPGINITTMVVTMFPWSQGIRELDIHSGPG